MLIAEKLGRVEILSRAHARQQTRQVFAHNRAVLLFPSGPDYVAAFFGCLYAGVIAVPAYPPGSTRRHHQERLLSIISDAEPRLLLTSGGLRDGLQQIWCATNLSTLIGLAAQPLDEVLSLPPNGSFPFPAL
ncbi:AMP-binding protein [Pseudomonas sp. KB_15]